MIAPLLPGWPRLSGRTWRGPSGVAVATSSALTKPSTAPRNAAVSAAAAIPPPRQIDRCQPPGVQPVDRRARRERVAPQCLPHAHVRVGKADDRVQPRQECLVECGLRVRGEDRQTAERLHPLQQVADLEVGVAVVAVANLGPLAETTCRPRRRAVTRHRPRRRRTSGAGSSRSPRCTCLTTWLRSTTTRSRLRSRAITSAAMGFPVPLGPANSAVVPSSRALRCAKPQPSSTVTWCRTAATSACSCSSWLAGSTRSSHPARGSIAWASPSNRLRERDRHASHRVTPRATSAAATSRSGRTRSNTPAAASRYEDPNRLGLDSPSPRTTTGASNWATRGSARRCPQGGRLRGPRPGGTAQHRLPLHQPQQPLAVPG